MMAAMMICENSKSRVEQYLLIVVVLITMISTEIEHHSDFLHGYPEEYLSKNMVLNCN